MNTHAEMALLENVMSVIKKYLMTIGIVCIPNGKAIRLKMTGNVNVNLQSTLAFSFL